MFPVMNRKDYCVIIPTYNNGGTLPSVIEKVLQITPNIMVVNDGSTDETDLLLERFAEIVKLSYMPNKGKGHALKIGFQQAVKQGFRYAITLDADGQHFPEELPRFLEVISRHPDAMVVGSRFLEQENMPKKNSFANRFSNFWFYVHTLQKLPDTQSGYRLYPLVHIKKMHILTNRYETELEILVKMAWRFVPVISVPISVFYAPAGERISHFKPFHDFFRISLLNTVLTFIALLYFYPRFLIHKIAK